MGSQNSGDNQTLRMILSILTLLMGQMVVGSYLNKYQYNTSWNNKRRLMVVLGDGLIRQIKREVDQGDIKCELSVRNMNMIYLSDNTSPQDITYKLGNPSEIRELTDSEVESIKNEIRISSRAKGDVAFLVGYDGGVKMTLKNEVNWKKVFERIDKMPMRRQEIRNGAVC